MSDLSSLIERLEKLDGPSREIEARIHYALFPDQEVLLDPGDVRTKRPGKYGHLSQMPIDGWDDYTGICLHIGAGKYTASIDAVVALIGKVLPGWEYSIGGTHPEFLNAGEHRFAADLMGPITWRQDEGWPEPDYEAYGARAPTPAIALCIALLQAIKEREGKPG